MQRGFIIVICLLTVPCHGAPQSILMPWHFFQLANLKRGTLQTETAEATKLWVASLLPEAKPLPSWLEEEEEGLVLESQKMRSQGFWGGGPIGNAAEPTWIKPYLCKVGQRYLVGLSVLTPKTLVIRLDQHRLVEEKAWQAAEAAGQLAALLGGELNPLGESLASGLEQPPEWDPNDLFKPRLSLARNLRSQTTGSPDCVAQILMGDLARSTQMPAVLGYQDGVFLKRLWQIQEPPTKANRALVLDISLNEPLEWPLTLTMRVRKSEAVFGAPFFETESYPVILTEQNQTTTVTWPKAWQDFLAAQKDSLKRSDAPQVVKIDRRWAYLDRGRAYGLEIGDRLMSRSGPLKGHVVGFYGPGLNIRKKDQKIYEGAILYIRTGSTQLGDELVFDPTRFPTAWPPEKTPTPEDLGEAL